MSVLIETTVGDLVFDLHTEERPRSTLNFLKLCKVKYYNYCLFHSVRRNFIAQCGDPTGTGRGGESIFSFIYGDQAKYFDLEPKPRIKHKTKGTISFVNNGNDKHGSQFFITLGEGLDFLDGKHTIFGTLAEGFETLETINETICDEKHKPYRDVRITHTIILYDPYEDPKGLVIPDRSPEPTQEQLESGRIGAEEALDDDGKSKEEVQKEIEDKELQIGTQILETVGDIKEADEKPPENVLFVCKLNPITKAEDLKIIFSRFGKIKSCEIIKDFKTGESLCYGFVEFKEIEACEKAYTKMDNVLIDDRRIHVDFCQSVGKAKAAFDKSMLSKNIGRDERPGERVYDFKENRSKRKEDKYSMLFEEESGMDRAKDQRQDSKNSETKEKMRKNKNDSEYVDDRSTLKVNPEKKGKTVKDIPKRPKSPPMSRYEEESRRDKQPVKKEDSREKADSREKPVLKKRSKREERMENDSSTSSENEADKITKHHPKKKKEHKKIDMKGDESEHKYGKKGRKQKNSDDSDSEKESKRKVKRRKSESGSDSEDESKIRIQKSKKEKPLVKKRKTEDTDEEYENRASKRDKVNKSTLKKRKVKKSRSEDSESDADHPKVKSKSRQKKRSDHSSDESSSSEDEKKQLKPGKSKRRQENSSDDNRKKKNRNKHSVKKKKVKKRHASSGSDSSD